MTETKEYLEKSRNIIDVISYQEKEIQKAAEIFSSTILAGRMVHVFGSGHSRIMVEEMWPRYGSFPGFNPIVELSLTFHNLVVGANGQRQAMFLENVSGFAERILRNYKLSDQDAALVISSSGTNIVPVEIAELFQKNNIKVVSIITKSHSEASKSKRADGKKLSDFSDIILDTGAPVGDAMIQIENLETPVAPGSTLGGVLLINSIKATVAAKLTKAGHPPTVLSAANKVGEQKAVELFEKAYDEHAIRLSKLYQF
ncbi:MAG: sugar isomerase domain-containing protein [Chitinophagaceae bacterium]